MKFRKKPVVIEAEQYTDESQAYEFAERHNGYVTLNLGKCALMIRTLEGDHLANLGDWIITGVKGEKYPCKPDIFELTYEKV